MLPGLNLLALPAIFPSAISSFLTQNKGWGGGGAGSSSRSATASNTISFIMTTLRKYYTVDAAKYHIDTSQK